METYEIRKHGQKNVIIEHVTIPSFLRKCALYPFRLHICSTTHHVRISLLELGRNEAPRAGLESIP